MRKELVVDFQSSGSFLSKDVTVRWPRRFFFNTFYLFVCPEVEMVISREDPPLMLACGRSNTEEGVQFRQ